MTLVNCPRSVIGKSFLISHAGEANEAQQEGCHGRPEPGEVGQTQTLDQTRSVLAEEGFFAHENILWVEIG